MDKSRMEAFSDGVMAVAITVMALGLKVPETTNLAALKSLTPGLLTYILSFVYIGIYWNNHHHLLQAVDRVSGRALWANLHLLFWITLIPLTTAWMREHAAAALPTAIYGVVLLLAAVAFYLLARCLINLHGADSTLAKAVGQNRKNILSVVLYAAAIPLAFVHAYLADLLYVCVAIIWLIPDQRIESYLAGSP